MSRGKPSTIFSPEQLQRYIPLYQAALNEDETDLEYTSATGRAYHSHVLPVRDDQKHIIGGLMMVQNMTQRKHIEEQLRENPQMFLQVLTSTPDVIYIYDVETQRNVFNSRDLGAMLGYMAETFAEIEGDILANILHPDDNHRQSQALVTLAQTEAEAVVEAEFRLRDGAGQWRWFKSRSRVFNRHPDGTIKQIIGLLQDIDQRKRTEDMLREREYVIRHIAATVPDIIYIYDFAERRNVYANHPFGEAIGYSADAIEAMGDSFIALTMHPHDWPRFNAHFAKFAQIKNGVVLELEYRIKTPQGRWLWFNSRDTVFTRDSNGAVTQILGVAHDITERKVSDAALRESEERFRQIAETVHSVFCIFSPDFGRTYYVSPSYETVWGRPAVEMYEDPTSFLEAVHPQDKERVTQERAQKPLTATYNVEYRIIRPDETVRWVRTRAYPITNAEGGVDRIISVSDDITEYKLLEKQALAAAMEREQSRLLADFIGHSSHDLRTPLTIILTGLYLIRRITDPQQREERINAIEKQVHYLNKLINDFHMMATLDSTAHIELSTFDINVVVQQVIKQEQTKIDEKQQTIMLNLQADLPSIRADEEKIRLALTHVVANAIYYTDSSGTITIETQCVRDEIVISIQDNGVGIEARHLPLIFERFYKVDTARSSGKIGPGLGLSIVKKIMELHQGRVEVESVFGQGTLFRLFLPIADRTPE